MKRYISVIILSLFAVSALYSQSRKKDYSLQVDSVLSLMTLEEKIGQMNQYSNDRQNTGPVINNQDHLREIREGRVGSMLNVTSVTRANQYQDEAMKSRLRIPLLFGLDVIHGMKTIFPIPLGEAASFDLELMRKTAEIAAEEASAHGVHWTFAPNVDVSRDARWGRVMETSGEDTWYGKQVAKVRVEGFQGNGYENRNRILACAKHFAAYGAAVAGKDYAEVDISENTLHQVYLPPFKAALDAGVATFMHSFNEINGIPAAAHKYLQRDLLKDTWGFGGFVVSDWGSVGDLAKHGYAKDIKESALLSALAGCDMDMCSESYIKNLEQLIKEGLLDVALIDDAVRRILTKKFELGLFDDPYCFNRREHELDDKNINGKYRDIAREMGAKSIVLLKNEAALPIANSVKNIAVVGPLNKSQWDMLGNWSALGKPEYVITVLDGLKKALPKANISYHEGYNFRNNELLEMPDLKNYDLIIVAVGEKSMESGEAKSKVDININKNHQQLVKNLKENSDCPVVALVMGGRPLVFKDMEPYADAILITWWLGVEAGNSIADVLTGKYNPSGKLPVTYPQHSGQCPIYYNTKRTGRPWRPKAQWVTGYMDATVLPAYAFGYGLSYTQFEISEPTIDKNAYDMDSKISVKVTVKNTGKYKGCETVQLYLQDVAGSITRPVIELCGFRRVDLEPNETKEIEFILTSGDLGFFNAKNEFVTEPGDFKIFVGNSSDNLKSTQFELIKK
ncbi:glycoside hydrolase family 3 N-terminal domain-containing protein [Dysgonomonas sp. 520]|uniref:glycoside hydrolase family 3 N-terminal domain-containing protein n=1 Tax=Dysgonomonas sp. 520 TaxID=2302931 RepID=UPI0013D6826B|nr:glycoside hydrolase family 3 N-terminal domain-containing protein [Dysgonomonas sp. 520]NDW10724.1 glycosyl hydrolase [Dysgonomonas sp. 520]